MEDADDPSSDGARPSRPTVFMAVPTMYAKLLEVVDNATVPADVVDRAVELTLRPMRLQVSGSAALPVSLMDRWKALTGQTLLERYGMTEFGMALSNPYHHVGQRHPGHVGKPLPSVQVRLVDDDDDSDDDSDGNESPPGGKRRKRRREVLRFDNTTHTTYDRTVSGSLQVRGPTVFSGGYWNRPDATIEAFCDNDDDDDDDGGWFDTGDVAEFHADLQSFRILGRRSVDVFKVGGNKVSALEVERVLLEHPQLVEVYVVGVDDDMYGQRVAVVARPSPCKDDDDDQRSLTLSDLQDWCTGRTARYHVPSKLLLMDDIPKNAMGKVNKKHLVKLFETVF
jgi:malonyl-CoA/methylmalonyl-CoA synthetase